MRAVLGRPYEPPARYSEADETSLDTAHLARRPPATVQREPPAWWSGLRIADDEDAFTGPFFFR